MGVVIDLVGVDDRLELDRGRLEATAAEVGAAERLADRGLLRSLARRLLQRHGGLLEVGLLEQLDAAAIEGEGRVAVVLGAHGKSVGGAVRGHSAAASTREPPLPGRPRPRGGPAPQSRATQPALLIESTGMTLPVLSIFNSIHPLFPVGWFPTVSLFPDFLDYYKYLEHSRLLSKLFSGSWF